ncbi:hypothetical protein [Thermococcus sp. MAR1]|uniref:hypothetical protein n=1 Tax=Thermococcus sp. MAR1 TaxID=1638263 RepID=UPI00143913ED|nr:hypothetical protein [Thermococcus sp. MAR1]NJE09342.1 hypothetical protein [Thermococcus sp. MAR1]
MGEYNKRITENVPPTHRLIERAISELGYDIDTLLNSEGISSAIADIILKSRDLYLNHRDEILKEYRDRVRQECNEEFGENTKESDDCFSEKIQKFTESFFQSKFSRGGDAFEIVLSVFLDKADIPYVRKSFIPIYPLTVSKGKDKTIRRRAGENIDFIVPLKRNIPARVELEKYVTGNFPLSPSDFLLISAKHRVRERWREVVGELAVLKIRYPEEHLKMWFVTLDEKITLYPIFALMDSGVERVYVRDDRFYVLSDALEELEKAIGERISKLQEKMDKTNEKLSKKKRQLGKKLPSTKIRSKLEVDIQNLENKIRVLMNEIEVYKGYQEKIPYYREGLYKLSHLLGDIQKLLEERSSSEEPDKNPNDGKEKSLFRWLEKMDEKETISS